MKTAIEGTDLDLVGDDLDADVDDLLHILGVEIAESEILDSVVFLQVLPGLDVLLVVVLTNLEVRAICRSAHKTTWTHKLPMELQQVDPVGR